MKTTSSQTHNQRVLEKMRHIPVTQPQIEQDKHASMPEQHIAAKADGPTSLRTLQRKNGRLNYDLQRTGVDELYARMGKSIECGEYDAARLIAGNLQSALERLNNAANRLADLD